MREGVGGVKAFQLAQKREREIECLTMLEVTFSESEERAPATLGARLFEVFNCDFRTRANCGRVSINFWGSGAERIRRCRGAVRGLEERERADESGLGEIQHLADG